MAEINRSARRVWSRVAWTRLRSGLVLEKERHVLSIKPMGNMRAAFLLRDNIRHRRDIENAYLQAMAEKLGEDGKAKAQQQLTSLRQKRDEVSEKLKELGSSSGNAWEQIKSGIDAAMEDLGNGYKKAMAELTM